MNWDNPEPGVYEASANIPVSLEVFAPDDDDPELYVWIVLCRGRIVAEGETVGFENAKAAVERWTV